MLSLVTTSASSHDILALARCNNNAPEVVSLLYTPRRAARFVSIRSSRADSRAAWLVIEITAGLVELELRCPKHGDQQGNDRSEQSRSVPEPFDLVDELGMITRTFRTTAPALDPANRGARSSRTPGNAQSRPNRCRARAGSLRYGLPFRVLA